MTSSDELEVRGRRVRLTTLDRVYFPATGTTKSELLGYYIRVADVILPHLRERLLHMHRYPEGVTGPRFWQKGCPEHRPEWMSVAPVWSREGPGATILHGCELALRVRDMFAAVGLRTLAKTSGSKGLQVYLPLNTAGVSYRTTKAAARYVAELLEHELPGLATSRIAREARRNRVLVDWGQNTEHKSTVCAYSVRARERPTVSTPVTWEEAQGALDAGDHERLHFEIGDVAERVAQLGDPFAAVLEVRQELRPSTARPQTSLLDV